MSSKWAGEAHDRFTAWEAKYTGILHDLATDCSTMAGHLDSVADYLEAKNEEIHHLYEAMAATAAVGIGLSIITFGFSDAAAAAAGAAEVGEAQGVVAAITSFLSAMADSMASTLASFAGRWALAFGINLTFNEGYNLLRGKGLDFGPAMWTASIDGATGGAAVPTGFMEDVPFSGAVRGAVGGLAGSALTTAIDGDPFSLRSLERDLLSAGISGAFGEAFNRAWPGGNEPGGTGSQLVDPDTGLRFGEIPGRVQLLGPSDGPLGTSPQLAAGGLVDPVTGQPFGAQPGAVMLLGPTGDVVVGTPSAPPELLNPATGQPFNAPPGRIVVVDRSGTPIGATAEPTLLGPDGRPIAIPTPTPGVTLPEPREVVEGYLDSGADALVEWVLPKGDGHYEVQAMIVPTSEIEGLQPAPTP